VGCESVGLGNRISEGFAMTEQNQAAGPAVPVGVIYDLVAHLHRQREFSQQTFGPGARTAGVCDHIRKELVEIADKPNDVTEWVDVVLLALDGAWRAGYTPEQIAAAIEAKQTKNEGRDWPDWRTAPADKAIEHDRSGDSRAPAAIPGEYERVETERETVVLGNPPESYPDSWADDDPRRHDCDAMGCGQAHVLARIKKAAPAPDYHDGCEPLDMPEDLHPDTRRLVVTFAMALSRKLKAAQDKYGYSNGWMSPDWMNECRAKLVEHLSKGDPRDVAAYCAFLWFHGERTAAPAPEVDAERYRLLRRGQQWSVINGIGDTLRGENLDAAIDAARAKEGGA
jgi:hypothetical protein